MYNRRAESIASSTINLLRLPLHRRRTSLLLVSLRCRLKCLRKSDNDKVLARVSVGTTEKRMLGIEKGANVILISSLGVRIMRRLLLEIYTLPVQAHFAV